MKKWLAKSLDVFPKTIGVPRSPQSKRLKALALDNLLGKLLTFDIHLKEDEEEAHTKRGVAFKTTNEKLYCSQDESSEGDKDNMAIITRGLKKMFKSNRFDPYKFYKKGSSSKREEKKSTGTKTTNNKNESNLGPCFIVVCQVM